MNLIRLGKIERRRILIPVVLLAGLMLAGLNGLVIDLMGRKADIWVEGIVLWLLLVALASLWLEWQRNREHSRRTMILFELSRTVNGPFDITEILQAAIQHITKALDLDAGAINLLDEDHTDAVILAEYKQPEMLTAIGMRIHIDTGASSWMTPILQGQQVILKRNDQLTADPAITELFERRGSKVILVLPLFADQHLHGMMALHSVLPRQFSEQEIRFARAAAEITANAIAKAGRLEDAQRRAAHLAVADSVAQRLLANNQFHNLPQQVTDTLAKSFPTWNFYLFLFDPLHSVLVLKGKTEAYTTSIEVNAFCLRRMDGLVGIAFREKRYVLVNDVTTDSSFIPGDLLSPSRSEVVIPIQSGGEVLGIIDVQSAQINDFNEDDARVFNNVAHDVGSALVNARLLNDLRHSITNLERLQKASLKALSASSIERILSELCAVTCEAIRADQVSMMLVDAQRYCYLWVGHNYPKPLKPHMVRPHGITMSVLHSKNARFFPDFQIITNANPGMVAEGLHGAACLPLHGREGLIGVMWINFREKHPFPDPERILLSTFAAQAGLVIEQLRLIENLKRHSSFLTATNAFLLSTSRPDVPSEDLLKTVLDHALRATHSSAGALWLTGKSAWGSKTVTRGFPSDVYKSFAEAAPRSTFDFENPILISNWAEESGPLAELYQENGVGASITVPIRTEKGRIGGLVVALDDPHPWSADERMQVEAISSQIGLILERASLAQETLHRLRELEAVQSLSTSLRKANNPQEVLRSLLDTAIDILDTSHGDILLPDESGKALYFAEARGWPELVSDIHLSLESTVSGQVFLQGQPQKIEHLLEDPNFSSVVSHRIPIKDYSGLFAPIRDEDHTVGVIFIGGEAPRSFTDEDLQLLTTLAEIGGTALRREFLRSETEARVRQLQAIHNIDSAILGSMELDTILNTMLEEIHNLTSADAAAILQYEPNSQSLSFAAGFGFLNAPKDARIPLGVKYAGVVAQEKRPVMIRDIRIDSGTEALGSFVRSEGFIAYCGFPLIAKDQVKGVLEIFHRKPFGCADSKFELVETLAGQAAIALDYIELFQRLQQSNLELEHAYDETIEGWSAALDMRDKETEGHAKRVTEMTLKLAEMMGVSQQELVQVKRGALLHDIGKMGIPDRILLKPDTLTEEEWEIMRRHPTYAYQMLKPIAYLEPALDIPYCHHEKWDGTGYPRGLKGDQIPLVARIFALADVYDALTSDRPYRNRWPATKALEYILGQSGSHFDARVVEVFLKMVGEGKQELPDVLV